MVVNKLLCHNPLVCARDRTHAERASRARRLASLTCVLGLVLAGCYWLRYHDLVETHCGLLEDLSIATLAQVQASPPRLTPGDVERLRYPLVRAREFLAISEKRFAGRQSLLELTALVGVYGELIEAVERMRVGMADGSAVPHLVAEIRARAERVREAVRDERGAGRRTGDE
jgi:hypothetical protein